MFSWVRNGTLIQWLNYKVFLPQVAFSQSLRECLVSLIVIVAAIAAGGIFAGLAQTRCLFRPSQLTQGFQHYTPGAYLKRVRQSFVDSCVGILRCAVVGVGLAPILVEVWQREPAVGEMTLAETKSLCADYIQAVVMRGAALLALIALVAYSIVRWKFSRELRMSLQELKDEFKEDEGDPHARAARKQEHRALLFSEVERRVKSAKVVIVRQRRT
jgi:flagellar biosynthesis protein FlhB